MLIIIILINNTATDLGYFAGDEIGLNVYVPCSTSSTIVTVPNALKLNTWSDLHFTMDDDRVFSFFKDGELVLEKSLVCPRKTPFSTDYVMIIGGPFSTPYSRSIVPWFSGDIDDIRLVAGAYSPQALHNLSLAVEFGLDEDVHQNLFLRVNEVEHKISSENTTVTIDVPVDMDFGMKLKYSQLK